MFPAPSPQISQVRLRRAACGNHLFRSGAAVFSLLTIRVHGKHNSQERSQRPLLRFSGPDGGFEVGPSFSLGLCHEIYLVTCFNWLDPSGSATTAPCLLPGLSLHQPPLPLECEAIPCHIITLIFLFLHLSPNVSQHASCLVPVHPHLTVT